MTSDTILGGKQAGVFKTFPEFTKLKLADRPLYEALAVKQPPVDTISFTSLMTCWNAMDASAVALLDGNLIISYWLPDMMRFSGLSIIGETRIDEAICTIFDYQKSNGEQPHLVHVPEFVVNAIEHPELFTLKPMREFDEYLMPVSTFFPLASAVSFKQKRIQRFRAHAKGREIVAGQLDLGRSENRILLLEAMVSWSRHSRGNDFSKYSDEVACKAIAQYKALGIENLCLYVGGDLQGFILYYFTHDKRYASVINVRANNALPCTFEYEFYALCEQLSVRGVELINQGYDVGLQRLRTLKVGLGATGCFRKYIIEPAK